MTYSLARWDIFKDALDKLLVEDRKTVVEKAAQAAMVVLDEAVRNQLPPPVRKQSQSQHWTAKQRRWWWATMRAKALGTSRALPGWKASFVETNGRKQLKLSGSYRRTGTLVKSMTYAVSTSGSTTTAKYGTNRKYARYVVDEERQAKYHEGNWPTLQAITRRELPRLQTAFSERLTQEINQRLS